MLSQSCQVDLEVLVVVGVVHLLMPLHWNEVVSECALVVWLISSVLEDASNRFHYKISLI